MARFTAANAREMAARSVTVRKAAEAQRLAEPEVAAEFPSYQRAGTGEDGVAARRLARVSNQIERVNSMIDGERDSSRMERLTRALSVLYNLDTQLRRPAIASQSRLSRAAQRENSRPMVSGFDDVPLTQREEAAQREQSREDMLGFVEEAESQTVPQPPSPPVPTEPAWPPQ